MKINIHNGHVATCNCCIHLSSRSTPPEHVGGSVIIAICKKGVIDLTEYQPSCGHSRFEDGATCKKFKGIKGDAEWGWEG